MNDIFLVSNLLKVLLISIFIIIVFLHYKRIIKSDLLDFILEIYDYSILYNSFLRFIFRLALVLAIVFIIMFFSNIVTLFSSRIIKNNIENNIFINKYENTNKTNDFRNLEYIGGVNVWDNNINFKRWIDLYLDLNTNEVLRGGNNSNYITAGLPLIGKDKMVVPSIRQTKKGFQDYILQWTGSVMYDINSNDLRLIKYGNSKSFENFNKPIDILSDINWNNSDIYKYNEKYLISTLSEVKINCINNTILESNGRLNGISYIYSILRNCFGFISDDFYSLGFNKIHFNSIDINDIEIGDIGIKELNNKIYQIGMCIGFDERNNPIFTLCDNIKNGVPEYLNKKNTLQEKEILGYNILHIEPKNFFDRYIWQKRIFDKYYRTNLPFINKNMISSNIYKFQDKKYQITEKDIEKYNNQVYGCVKFKKKDYYIDMSKKIYEERIRRIKDRENKAISLCNQFSIEIIKYENMNIDDFVLIYDINTYQYKNFINNYGKDRLDYYKNKYRKLSKEEKQQKEYELNKELFLDRLNNDINDLKNLSLDEIYKYYEEKGTLIMAEGKKLVEEFYYSIHN